MKRLKIYLARHGQDKDNAKGILNGHRNKPLTKTGVLQAKELAKKIKKADIKLGKIFSSPLQRTLKTAEIIAKTLSLEKPEKLDLLIERNFGIMTGQPRAKILKMCLPNVSETKKVNYFLSPRGAETFPELITRGKRLLGYIGKRHKEGNVLLVTHGDFGKMIYAAYYDLYWKEVLKMFHFGNSDLLLLSKNSPPEKTHVFQTQQYDN